ncbi:hypothetical protein AB833_12050 [Chromatiales bacterium (ex Bugula neritina AB1)]|nr:hypothetical protein AB833_12050 [Chromatiales bacterium (ex Bugula neritina AB1)]
MGNEHTGNGHTGNGHTGNKHQNADPWCGASPLAREQAVELLTRVLQQCPGKTVVFDLDSTLLNNRPRNAVIMREFSRIAGVSELAEARADHWQDWSAARAMANMGLNPAQVARHLEEFEQFWGERFFTSEYCVHDEQINGAAVFVGRVAEAGASIIYLTGRPEEMRYGTLQCLQRLGFPVPASPHVSDPAVVLTMKPESNGSDDTFKFEQARQLEAHKQVAAVFDNEPQHINTYNELLTHAECIHLFTDHSMREIPLRAGIPSIVDFKLL